MDLELQTETELRAENAQRLPAFSGINLPHIRGQVSEALTNFGRFGLLDEYTKHDISHIDAMLKMYDWMIPAQTQSLMTPADWLLATLTTYLHDFGLVITRDEFDARETVPFFEAYRHRIRENDDPEVQDYRAQLTQMDEHASDLFLYQEFVRYYHAQRIRAWLQESPDGTWGIDVRVANALRTLLEGVEDTFLEDVGIVCESHHLDDLANLRKYPLDKPYGSSREEEANVQYAALLLRTADLLHITSDRVPAMSALIINPRNPRSQVEWSKQKAVRRVRPLNVTVSSDDGAAVDPDTIEVHATFKEAEGYFGLTNYLQYAAKQLTETFSVSRENQATGASEYVFPWRRLDISHIEARGFVTQPFKFTIDQGKILDLLTGHTLYNDTRVVVRELVQNSLDAVRLQQIIEGPSYAPHIRVTWNGAERVLSVLDNGTGMTQSVIERNFLGVGSSRYQEPQFLKDFPEFASISRFGIGVLSTFMVADDVSVVTSHESEPKARQLSLRDVHGQYLVRLLDKLGEADDVPPEIRAHGTVVRLKLRPSAELDAIDEILRHWIVVPGCPVELIIDEQPPISIGFATVADCLRQALLGSRLAQSNDAGLSSQYGAPIQIRTYERDDFQIAYAVTWSRWLQEWQFMTIIPDSPDEERAAPSVTLGIAVSGVRVTTDPPGYRVGGIASMVNVGGKRAPRTNVARSALERTDEYDALLRQIYRAFLHHVSTEMTELEDSRQSSLTGAAREGGYLTEDMGRGLIEMRSFFEEELLSLPVIVIEEKGIRRRASLGELARFEELSSLESAMIHSFESVLQSVRGVSSASLRNMLDATGSSNKALPSVPLICGLGSARMVRRVFTAKWEVVRFSADEDGRELEALWKPATDSRRWQYAQSMPPPGLGIDVERTDFLRHLHNARPMRMCIDPTAIEVDGFSDKLVLSFGELYVLPSHPVLSRLALKNIDMSESGRYWAAGILLALLLPDSQRYSGFEDPILSARGFLGDTSSRLRVIDRARAAGILDVVTESSVEAVLQDPQLEVLDVQRWGNVRRHGSQA